MTRHSVERLSRVAIAALLIQALGCAPRPLAESRVVRAAVIGGMVETGFWQSLASRFEKDTGYKVEVVSTGPKAVIAEAFRAGHADLITMHASDTIINLVADGYAINPQPWLKNDLVIVGPGDDPAGVRGMTDAGKALGRLQSSGSRFVVHSSLGAQEVLRNITQSAGVTLDESKTTILLSDRAREVLQIAADQKAYTLIGRIPFLNGKLPNAGLDLLVKGDERLRRPYVVAVANPARLPGVRFTGAKTLAAYLRDDRTQGWIREYREPTYGDEPVFFPVAH